jgi:hypothetical protein
MHGFPIGSCRKASAFKEFSKAFLNETRHIQCGFPEQSPLFHKLV